VTIFRPVAADEIAAAHTAYVSVYDWLNAKGVRQWLRPLTPETFAHRQHDGQLFALWIDHKIAAVVTLAFESSPYWPEIIGNDPRWWVKSLAVIRAWRGEGIGQRVMNECEAIVQNSGANEVYLDCVSTGFLPPYYTALGYQSLAERDITYPSGFTFPMVLMRKQFSICNE
jgi:GNAT superfamily N-acetyltransferase